MPRDAGPGPDRPGPDRLRERRQRVAHEAARLMALGEADLDAARRHAARQLGESSREALPEAAQVLDELRLRHRLFRGPAQTAALRRLREAAVEAMVFLATFEPRLVGAVLQGTADAGAPVRLQLFADEPEALPRYLADHAIPARAIQERLRMPGGTSERVPAWTFDAGGVNVELVLLPTALLRTQLPGDDPGLSLRRAGLRELRELLERETS
jgi:hypothetical protein